ncbi:lactonase family protein [Candidatus Bathyarchaeota archaeon]|nr:lactonase family protein [Candidatus Bathyarchaeota archaeon]
MTNFFVYVGTYTSEGGKGIHIYQMDPESGMLEELGRVTGVVNPSFLAIDSEQRHLYAVNEVLSFGGEKVGAVSSFSIDEKSGKLTFLNNRFSKGAGPCYLSLDETNRYIFVTNYDGGSVCVLPINGDGSLGEPVDFVRHEGSSINPLRQEGPHPHSVITGPGNMHVYVADLGLDKVMIYKFSLVNGKLSPADQPYVRVKAGAGPRHFVFHPNGKFAYLINELDSTIVAYAYNEKNGSLEEIQTVSTLPIGFRGVNYAADLHLTPSGTFLYGSNRGHDSLAIYRVDGETGRLSYVGHENTGGRTPRNFAIDPSGRFLLVANRRSNNVVVFQINLETGLLKPTGYEAHVPSPACIKIVSHHNDLQSSFQFSL